MQPLEAAQAASAARVKIGLLMIAGVCRRIVSASLTKPFGCPGAALVTRQEPSAHHNEIVANWRCG